MGRKAKYTKEQKVQACEDYLKGRKTVRQIAVELNMSKNGSDIVFKTKGYGHGVGMSQYGAVYMANNGTKYIDILSHYYKNTNIKKI